MPHSLTMPCVYEIRVNTQSMRGKPNESAQKKSSESSSTMTMSNRTKAREMKKCQRTERTSARKTVLRQWMWKLLCFNWCRRLHFCAVRALSILVYKRKFEPWHCISFLPPALVWIDQTKMQANTLRHTQFAPRKCQLLTSDIRSTRDVAPACGLQRRRQTQ